MCACGGVVFYCGQQCGILLCFIILCEYCVVVESMLGAMLCRAMIDWLMIVVVQYAGSQVCLSCVLFSSLMPCHYVIDNNIAVLCNMTDR
jgi:hypothetical protein